ncbi:CpaE family protein [Paeniroseomonas aquatica]|uniref:AAA family ATPase n=1 Tax=Paeniroseomonas aquatica TaxID=373043 RepID=UPI00361EF386
MPDGPQTSYQDRAEALLHRPDRKQFVCFCADAATEEALRAGLAEAALTDAEFIRADAAQAIALLRDMPTPWTLLVDVTGHPQPLAALDDLAHVVEPDVRVLVVGDRQDVGFYRQLTRSLGVVDYLYKPLSAGMVAEHFGPIATGRGPQAQRNHGGRLLSVTGVRGGVGASTIAANLAWYLGNVADRHTVVLDADLHRGSQALLLGAQPGAGLRNVLEHPSRVDEVFVDRAAAGVTPRLHLLAAEEALDSPSPMRRRRRSSSSPCSAAATSSSPTRPSRPTPSAAPCSRSRSIASWCWSRPWPASGIPCGCCSFRRGRTRPSAPCWC